MKIKGLENLSNEEINFELQKGGRFVVFNYCISAVFVTFKRGSDVYFIRSGESAAAKALPWTLLSAVAGWWGIPWGPIYTVQSIYKNSTGGIDVTQNILNSMRAPSAAAAVSTTR